MAASSSDHYMPSTSSASAAVTLVEPSRRRHPRRVLRLFRSLCRTFPVFTPHCRLPSAPCKPPPRPTVQNLSPRSATASVSAARTVTGTLFGARRGRVSLSVQENPRCLPTLVVELALQTQALLREMGSGMVRIALESEKRPLDKGHSHPSRLLEEPLWTVFCNGKKSGYGTRREASDEDLAVMEILRPVSMGAGVLPGRSDGEEVAYMRSSFEHVIASRDSETLYMVTPGGGNGPELTIFFVRV